MALSSKPFSFLYSPETPLPPTKPQTHTQLAFPLTSSCTSPVNTTITLQTKHQHKQPIIISNKDPFLFSYSSSDEVASVAFPSLAYSNTLFFKSAYNVQIFVADNEPEDKLVGRFRSAVLRAGIIQECKRRRFFETTREKDKRKTREAFKRYRKRRPQLKASKQDKKEGPKGYGYESGDDNWEFQDVEVPYC